MSGENNCEATKPALDKDKICYDCLKTKGFGISMPIIIGITLLTITGIFEMYTAVYIALYVFWGLIFAIVLLTIKGAHYSLREYCKVNGENYKDVCVIAVFTVLTVVAILAIVIIAVMLPGNVEWWTSVNRSWN